MTIQRSFIILFILSAAVIALPRATLAQDGPPANCVYVEQGGDFETEGAWQFTETPSTGFLDATIAHSGAQSAFVGIPADAENKDADSTVWQKMHLPDAKTITATLWLRSQAGDAQDNRYIVVWDLATDESTIVRYERVPEADWQKDSVDISAFAGKDILLIIGVHNDGQNNKAGVWVDDVRVMACDLQNATPAEVNTPTVAALLSPTITPSPAATATPTATPTATQTPSPVPSATLVSAPTPTQTTAPTATSAPTPAPQPTIAARRQSSGGLFDNNALPLLAAVFLSGLIAVIVIAIKQRR